MALSDLPLLQSSDLTLLGSFGITGGSFAFGGYGATFDPVGNGGAGSLILGGPDPDIDGVVRLGEINIPSLSGSATVLTAPTTVPNVGALNRVGGALVYNSRLIVSAYIWYDNGPDPAISHWRSSNKAISNLGSPVKVGTLNSGFYGGYMGLIPSEWQSALGGPCFTGQNSLSIIGRTSYGPALFAFDPDQIGVTSPVPVQPLVYYTQAHPMHDPNSTPTIVWNFTSSCAGCFFPPGTRSVCFVYRVGVGLQCYGTAQTINPSQGCEEISPGVFQSYDPLNQHQGHHAYPYQHRVLAYDALDLKAVKDGTLEHWEPQPYANWELTGIGAANLAGVVPGGLAYDSAGRKIYIFRGGSDGNFSGTPQISVWQHAVPAAQPTGTVMARTVVVL